MNEAKYRAVEQDLWESVGREPAEHFVLLPTLETRVRIQEVGEGVPVLFIHGGPNSGSTWAPLIEHIEDMRCLLLDRPGTGLSDRVQWRPGMAVDFASTLVSDTLDALGLDKAHVVASSFGGYCALWSAATAPDRILRMVQMGCPALLPDQQPPSFMKAMMIPGLRKVIAALPPTKRAQESIMRQIGHSASIDAGRLPEVHDRWYAGLQRYTDTMRNDFDLIYSVKGRGGFDQSVSLGETTLARVPTPTHFIWGSDDPFGGADVARWITDAMPNATCEMLPDSGHLPWLDDPSHVARATTRFLLE
jgi:4,5:9,10-diseco-3-hydroxy-5,9,17-trioxoandrosta-1(10),2-diene-4-oate hydrolase